MTLFQTQGEAEDALRRVGEDTLGLAADAFVTQAEFDFDAAHRGLGKAEAGRPRVGLRKAEPAGVPR
jgi:hypothetical protein